MQPELDGTPDDDEEIVELELVDEEAGGQHRHTDLSPAPCVLLVPIRTAWLSTTVAAVAVLMAATFTLRVPLAIQVVEPLGQSVDVAGFQPWSGAGSKLVISSCGIRRGTPCLRPI